MTPSSKPSPASFTVEIFAQKRPFRPILGEYLDSEREQVAAQSEAAGRLIHGKSAEEDHWHRFGRVARQPPT